MEPWSRRSTTRWGDSRDVALEDLNGDGKLDIATGNPNTVSILLNAGDGTFGAVHEYPAGRTPGPLPSQT